jgi:PhnB protein
MVGVNPISDAYPRVTPYLRIDGAAAALDFYAAVLGATERYRLPMGDRIGHAEIQIGESVIMICDENPDFDALGPKTIGGTPIVLCVYVKDVDSVCKAAEDSGAEMISSPEDRFYGDRVGEFIDPFGHRWSVMTHIEDVSSEEMQKRAEAVAGG